MTIPKDWPAFPRTATYSDGMTEIWPGMTLRQWYAGMAMQGWVSATSLAVHTEKGQAWMLPGAEDASLFAFAIADAMLAHEAKEEE